MSQCRVFVSYDGSLFGEPLFTGEYEACRHFIRMNLARYSRGGCWLDIMGSSGRLLSYVL